MESLHWISIPALLETIQRSSSGAKTFPVMYDSDGKRYLVFRFAMDMLRHIRPYLQSLAHSQQPGFVPPIPSSPNRFVSKEHSPRLAGSPSRMYHSKASKPRARSPYREPSPAHSRIFKAETDISHQQNRTDDVQRCVSSPSRLSPYARPFYPRNCVLYDAMPTKHST